MKNIFILLLTMFLFIGATNAQKYNRGFSDIVDTLQGADTLIFPFAGKIVSHSGFVAFDYTLVNTADSCNALAMQGSMDNTNWTAVSTQVLKTTTNALLSEEAPDYLYYRLYTSTATGDTVIFTAVNFIYKED